MSHPDSRPHNPAHDMDYVKVVQNSIRIIVRCAACDATQLYTVPDAGKLLSIELPLSMCCESAQTLEIHNDYPALV